MSAPTSPITAAMPWLYAEADSWWVITGRVSERHTVTECIAQVMPPMVTGVDEGEEPALFRVYSWSTDLTLISGDRISRAKRLVFVEANDPRRAYYDDEQDFIDAAEAGTEQKP